MIIKDRLVRFMTLNASTFRFWFDFCIPFEGCSQWVIIILLLLNQNPEFSKMCRVFLKSKSDCSSSTILGCLVKMPWEFPNKASHVRHTLCQVLKHGNKQTSDSEYSCPCYYSQIKCLGLHAVYIVNALCYIRIKKHLHNQIEIIVVERQ